MFQLMCKPFLRLIAFARIQIFTSPDLPPPKFPYPSIRKTNYGYIQKCCLRIPIRFWPKLLYEWISINLLGIKRQQNSGHVGVKLNER